MTRKDKLENFQGRAPSESLLSHIELSCNVM